MSNVLSEEKKQQVIALGRLGGSLRKIQKATGVHRTTAADYLRAAGVALRPPGTWGKAPPAKPTNEVTPDPGSAQPAHRRVPARKGFLNHLNDSGRSWGSPGGAELEVFRPLLNDT